MTPKEKAIELYNKYARFWHDTNETCKSQCLIAVDEMVKENESILSMLRTHGNARNRLPMHARLTFLQEVKEEITKL
jgi:hypothetical protein